MATASLDIDAQKCFTPLCPDELPVPEGHLIVAALNAQAKLADFRIGSKDAHCETAIWLADATHPQFSPVDGKHVDIHWRKHAITGSEGFELLDGLPHPAEYDYFVWKGIEPDMHPYGACYHDLENKLSTGLIEYLNVNDVDNVFVGGLALDYCVKTTVLQLREAGFAVTVNLTACRGIADNTCKTAKIEMQNAGAILADNL